jgi:6-phosphofructokinase 1
MITRQGQRIVPVPFPDIMDPKTGRTKVRVVDTGSASHASAASLQVRIEREDLERGENLEALARTLGLPPADVKARYAGVL